MAKIGRNAPCPCGSGKKYKKCCLGKKTFETKNSVSGRQYHWDLEEIRRFSTDRIISKLRQFRVDFEIEQFKKDVKNHFSGCALARHWEKIHPVNATGFDVDFIWMACIVLWERLTPDVFCSEKLDDIQRAEQAGAAAVVLHSLFEEQIVHEEMDTHELYEQGAESFAESLSFFPEFALP